MAKPVHPPLTDSTLNPRRSPRTTKTVPPGPGPIVGTHSTPTRAGPAPSEPTSLTPGTRKKRHDELARELFPELWDEVGVDTGKREKGEGDELVREEVQEQESDAETEIVEDSEDERMRNQLEDNEGQSGADSEEEEDVLLRIDSLKIHNSNPWTPPASVSSPPSESLLTFITKVTPLPTPNPLPRTQPKKVRETTFISLDDDDEEEEREKSPCDDEEIEKFEKDLVEIEDDLDPNEGVLVYNPTPRTVRKLPPSQQRTPRSTPVSPTKKKQVGSKLVQVLDLTESDEDSDIEVILPKKSLFPIPSTKSRPTPLSPLPPHILSVTPSLSPSLNSKRPSKIPKSMFSATDRAELPLRLIRELDREVFRRSWNGMKRGEDGEGLGLPPGIEVKWSNTLRNTAGRASWKKERIGGITTHYTTIELASKVIDSEDKLKHTLSHELCHVAAWVLSNELRPPHGEAFKLWGKRVMKVRPDINITTTHSYKIAYKFRWRCTSEACLHIFGRHSNSIDPTRSRCSCGNKLVRIDANGEEMRSSSANGTPRKRSAWDEYRDTMAPILRSENPGIAQTELFKLVAAKWRELKQLKEAEGMGALAESMKELGVHDA